MTVAKHFSTLTWTLYSETNLGDMLFFTIVILYELQKLMIIKNANKSNVEISFLFSFIFKLMRSLPLSLYFYF
jgi:hypothetical protein